MAIKAPIYIAGPCEWFRGLYEAFGLPADRVLSFRLDIAPKSLAIVEATLAADVEAIGLAAEVTRRYAVCLHELAERPETP